MQLLLLFFEKNKIKSELTFSYCLAALFTINLVWRWVCDAACSGQPQISHSLSIWHLNICKEKTHTHKNTPQQTSVNVRLWLHTTRCVCEGTKKQVDKGWNNLEWVFFFNVSFYTTFIHIRFWLLISIRITWPLFFDWVVKIRPFQNIKNILSHPCKEKKKIMSCQEGEWKKSDTGFWTY